MSIHVWQFRQVGGRFDYYATPVRELVCHCGRSYDRNPEDFQWLDGPHGAAPLACACGMTYYREPLNDRLERGTLDYLGAVGAEPQGRIALRGHRYEVFATAIDDEQRIPPLPESWEFVPGTKAALAESREEWLVASQQGGLLMVWLAASEADHAFLMGVLTS